MTQYPQAQHLPPHIAQAEREVAGELRELARGGEKMAAWANRLATVLLAVFSTASLLSLSLAAFNTFVAKTLAGQLDLPDALSVLLNLLLVLAMDMAMFYAATVIRATINAGGRASEMAVHVVVMVTASLLETATYIYLVVQYDHPTNAWLWAIGIGRGVAAPLFATYLSLARKLPVAPRDIAYYVALFSGKGVIHDVAVIAADATASLAGKVDMYSSAALMKPNDEARFQNIVAAATRLRDQQAKRQEEQPPAGPAEPAEQPTEAPTVAPAVAPAVAPSQPIPLQPRMPRAPQTERDPERPPALAPAARQLPPSASTSTRARRGLGRVGLPAPSRSSGPGRASEEEESAPPAISDEPAPTADRPATDRVDLRHKREDAARSILAENPAITAAELARRIAMATRTRIGESTARGIRDAVLAELAERQTPPPLRVPLRVIEGYATEAPADESAEDADDADDEERQRN